jgi:hypothetical protein
MPGPKELVGGEEVRAGVAEAKRLEPDDADRRQANGERHHEEG